MEHKLGETFWDILTTHSASGAAADADSTPTLKVYEEGGDMSLATPAGYTITNLTTGVYKYEVAWTAGNGFEVGKMYSIVLTAEMSGVVRNVRVGPVHCVLKDIDDLKDFDPEASEVNLGSILGTALVETTLDAGKIAGNVSTVFDNGDAFTVKTCDDIGGAAANHPEMLLDTAVASVVDATHYALVAGPHDDQAIKNQHIVFYDASENDSPSAEQKITNYDAGTLTVTLDQAPVFTVVPGDGVKVFVTAPGTTAATAGEIADQMLDETLAEHDDVGSVGNALHTIRNQAAGKVGVRNMNGTVRQIIYEDNESDERIVRDNTEIDSTERAMVPV